MSKRIGGTNDSSRGSSDGSDDDNRTALWPDFQTWCSKSYRRSLSDGILLHGRQEGALAKRCLSVPTMGSPPTPSLARQQLPTRRLSRSQAQLIIPRSVSEYLNCCRYSRSHSDGLLLASTEPIGALAGCRDTAPRALSEGLLGGRLFPTPAVAPSSPGGSSSGSCSALPAGPSLKPQRRVPLAELQRGAVLEGRIVHLSGIGVFVDVGAVRHGLVPWHRCRGIPRRLLQPPEVIANLEIVNVNSRRRQLSLRIGGIGANDANLEEVDYAKILQRIAGWAGVVLPLGSSAAATVAAASPCSRRTHAGVARGRRKRRGQATSEADGPRWRIKGEAAAKAAKDASSATTTSPRYQFGEGRDAAFARCPGRRGRKLLWRRKSPMGA